MLHAPAWLATYCAKGLDLRSTVGMNNRRECPLALCQLRAISLFLVPIGNADIRVARASCRRRLVLRAERKLCAVCAVRSLLSGFWALGTRAGALGGRKAKAPLAFIAPPRPRNASLGIIYTCTQRTASSSEGQTPPPARPWARPAGRRRRLSSSSSTS